MKIGGGREYYTLKGIKLAGDIASDKNYNAEVLLKRLDTAIKNESELCENIEKLEYSLGSNLGLLF